LSTREAILTEVLSPLRRIEADHYLEMTPKLRSDLRLAILCKLLVSVDAPWNLIFPNLLQPT